MQFGVKSSTNNPAHWVEAVQHMPTGFTSFTLDCPYPLPSISATTWRDLQSVQSQRSLAYRLHTPVGRIALGHIDSTMRQTSIQEVQRTIILAIQVGAGLIIVHPTPCHASERATLTQRELLQREALAELCQEAETQGVVITLENMQSPEVYAPGFVNLNSHYALLEEIPTLGITLDVGHANMAGVSLPEVVLRLGQRLRHIHVHDNDGSADQHLPVGEGTVDWLGLTQALVQIGYHGVMEFEFQGEAHLVASRRYLERLLS